MPIHLNGEGCQSGIVGIQKLGQGHPLSDRPGIQLIGINQFGNG